MFVTGRLTSLAPLGVIAPDPSCAKSPCRVLQVGDARRGKAQDAV
jgi:hypothetical protein